MTTRDIVEYMSILAKMQQSSVDLSLVMKLQEYHLSSNVFDLMVLWDITDSEYEKNMYVEHLREECNSLSN